jgi:hypothetical protein
MMTDAQHGRARIVDVTPTRVREALDQGAIAIVAGFQGFNHDSKDITTLGRGGSDTTAVALAAALDAARGDAMHEFDLGSARAIRETPGETHFRSVLQSHEAELNQSPGTAWLALVVEDFDRAVQFRQTAQVLRTEIEAGRAEFSAAGELLAAQIREQYEAPAWSRFTTATASATQSLQGAAQDVKDATAKAVLAALFVLAVTTIVITWPIRRLTASARRLAGGDLSTRVRPGGVIHLRGGGLRGWCGLLWVA